MTTLRVTRDLALVKPRPDLHRDSETGFADTQAIIGYKLTGEASQAFVEVVSLGPGGHVAPGRDMPDVKPGDVCIISLSHVGQEILLDGQKLYTMGAYDLQARVRTKQVRNLLGAGDVECVDRDVLPYPLMDRVLTERDPAGFIRCMYGKDTSLTGVQLSEAVLRDGMPTDDNPFSKVKFVYERVLDMGPGRVVYEGKGRHVRAYFSATDLSTKGSLTTFQPVRSTHWVANGRHFKLTPWSDCRGFLDE